MFSRMHFSLALHLLGTMQLFLLTQAAEDQAFCTTQ